MFKIKVYDNDGKTFDRYTVIINYDVYFMSPHADKANHVCSYDCNLLALADRFGYIKEIEKNNIKLNKIPKSLKYQIRNIIKGDRT
ncbi:MAG: hypothetical protein M0R80_04110 [Proteobacteria bacterium]|jgi:hypothetical protein|nr:hypothetical protein [Pseudomonadota bacterium]